MKQLCNLWGIELNKKRISDVAFVLHVRAYRESSLLIDFFTRHFGKVTSIAKGVKRPKSLLRSVLLPTTLLSISLVGKKDLKNLTQSEIIKHFSITSSLNLNCTLYLNELLIKFIENEDPHPNIFDQYRSFLASIEKQTNYEEIEALLRRFELILLKELGYGIDLDLEARTGKKIKQESTYSFNPMQGFSAQVNSDLSTKDGLFRGKDILNIARDDFSSSQTRIASKRILREALDNHLGHKRLNIRRFLTSSEVQND